MPKEVAFNRTILELKFVPDSMIDVEMTPLIAPYWN